MDSIGNESKIYDKIKEGFNKGLFELALEGWNQTDYTNSSEQLQVKSLEMANDKLFSIFGVKTNIFIPPEGEFNNDTVKAMDLNNFRILSAAKWVENIFDEGKNIFKSNDIKKIYNNRTLKNEIYHIPETNSFTTYQNDTWIKNSINSIIGNVTENLNRYGYSVISLHPQDFVKFVNNSFVNIVDENEIKKLSDLIGILIAKNITITSFSNISDLPIQIPPLPTSKSCPAPNFKSKNDVNSIRVPYPIAIEGLDPKHCSIVQIYNNYGKYLYKKSLDYHVSPSILAAALYAESRGSGFGPDGKMTIRFESCDFYRLWGKDHKKEFDSYFYCSKGPAENFDDKYRNSSGEQFKSYHGDHNREWKVFQIALGINQNAALNSISMGIGQIMGFNHDKIGYNSVDQMFNNMSNSIKYQLDGFFSAITHINSQTNVSCLNLLKENNYIGFANCYNASGQDELYGSNIKEAITMYKELTHERPYGG